MKSLVTAVYFLNDIARKEYLENYLTHLTVTDEYELAGIRDNVSWVKGMTRLQLCLCFYLLGVLADAVLRRAVASNSKASNQYISRAKAVKNLKEKTLVSKYHLLELSYRTNAMHVSP